MEVVVVGSGTAVPHAERVGSAYFVRVGPSRVLLDCGPGVVHHLARFELQWQEITHLCLSHFHTDHVGDVPALLFALKYGQAEARTAPLTILGPPGLRRFFRRLAAAFGDYIKDPGFVLDIIELKPIKRIPLNDLATISAMPTPHTEASIAFRIDGPQVSLGYTGDTDQDVDLGSFLQSVDLLITECSLPDELAMVGHMTPARVAAFARVALPKRLLLTHLYPQLPRGEVVDLVRAAGWDGDMLVADDGLKISLQ
ncbi:MAG TPA: ribonuclease Z [Longimicrobiales bacterium]|nr:ribonuclease Z [Longimicrobiales bacterium]